MNEFYNFHERLKAYILSTKLINTVTWGDIFDLDLNRKGDYALAHIMYQNQTITTSMNELQIDIILADIVNENLDNTLDVMNAMSVVGTMIAKSLDGGDLYDYNYRINASPTLEPFKERFEMNLAGWTLSMTIQLPNNITRCV